MKAHIRRRFAIAIVCGGLLHAGCAPERHGGPTAPFDAASTPEIRSRRNDGQVAESRLRLKKASRATETIVESDKQEPHYVGDGNGGFHFAYWIIHFRDNASSCYFWSTVHATAFTRVGDAQYCGAPPDNKAFFELHIDSADIVP